MWKFLLFCGEKTAFSITSDMFRSRHELIEARNMREISDLNPVSIEKSREREREFVRNRNLKEETAVCKGNMTMRETEGEVL